ncbi:UDP-N-acetylmuramate dehydrogenase [Mycoplasmatota bacterium]|nr:UDP-N-acetylmuramate dehydrogenase [Mycoplasmatota bacterium]
MIEVEKFLSENNYKNVKYDEPLSKHTTFRVGGKARIVVTPRSKRKIINLILFLKKKEIPFKVFGNGSNILPSDKDYEGVVIKTNQALKYMKVKDEEVVVGAGYSLVKLAHDIIEYELEGLEFFGGIPGTMGGAIYMNAGAYNKETKDVVLEVLLINNQGELVIYTNKDLKYSYRKSILQKEQPLLIIEAKLKLKKGNKDNITDILKQRKVRRQQTQPLEYPSGGSTFRNPNGINAYLLIDRAGLRGYVIGGAKVSEKHCNFIINYDKAKSKDVKDLVDYVINNVYQTTGKRLKPEIEFFNW